LTLISHQTMMMRRMMLLRMNMTTSQMGVMKMRAQRVMRRKENTMRRIRVKSLIDNTTTLIKL
jgi:hypothetical protein